MTSLRSRIEAALAKPSEEQEDSPDYVPTFDPWDDVVSNIYGHYSSQSDQLMIQVMEAVRDKTTFALMDREGFAAEFMLYVLAGHGLLEYGTSPRGGWPDPEIADLWQPLIDKWRAYYVSQWGEEP